VITAINKRKERNFRKMRR